MIGVWSPCARAGSAHRKPLHLFIKTPPPEEGEEEGEKSAESDIPTGKQVQF